MNVLPARMCITECLAPMEVRRGLDPLELDLKWLKATTWVLGTQPGSLKDLGALNHEPPLQLLIL